jgi:hypothetical protein
LRASSDWRRSGGARSSSSAAPTGIFTAPATPIATLQASSESGPSTRRKQGSTAAVQSDAPSSSGRRPMRSESAPNIGAARPRSRFSQRNATPTVASAIPASRTK